MISQSDFNDFVKLLSYLGIESDLSYEECYVPDAEFAWSLVSYIHRELGSGKKRQWIAIDIVNKHRFFEDLKGLTLFGQEM